jgi:hypothetical protein
MKTNFTHDVPVELDALLERLKRCDGKNFDSTVIVWEQCQMLVEEIASLRSQADLYKRGYELIGAADISNYLALCAEVRRQEQ